MAFKWTFNGVEMSQFVSATDVVRNVGQNRVANMTTIGHAKGKHFDYLGVDEGTVTVSAVVPHLDAEKRRQVAAVLSTDDPAPLIFSDEPDKYYDAICNGQPTLAETFQRGVISLSFSVHDDLAHAVTANTFEPPDVSSPADVPYAGTAPAYPILRQTVVAENGMVGWINSEGALLQFGDPEETDGEDLVKSDKVLRWNFQALPAGATINTGAVTPYQYYGHNTSHPNKFAGGINFGRDYTGKAVSGGEDAFPTFTTVTDTAWHGPALHGDVDANSDGDATGDFIVHARFYFEPEKNAYGRMEFTVETGGTSMLTGVLRDSSLKSTTKVFEWWLNGSWQKSVNLNAKTFKTNLMELQISRKGQAVSLRLATIESMKGDKITKNNGVYTFNATVDGIDEEPADGMTVTALQFSNKARATMYFTDLKFDWINVPYWQNIPNQFDVGDEVVADVGARKVFVNGAEADLYTVGNQWPKFAISGPEKIQAVVSSWSTQGPSSVTVREAYV